GIDHINVGAYIRNTLTADKNENLQDALFDIYLVMRPGEPPTMESAEAMFNSLFFDSERYDLSAVGRVKMNMRLDRFHRRRFTRTHDAVDVEQSVLTVLVLVGCQRVADIGAE
ncbi:hypothetical protein ACDA55_36760, partial [Rhizobium ruizarguesonis]